MINNEKICTKKVLKKIVIGITVVGDDREGIVATFTNFVFSQRGNIEKVNQNVIKGLFGMYLEASFTKNIDVEKFDSEIQKLAKKEKMDVNTHHETNTQKNIAIFVTKEPICLETILSAAKKESLERKYLSYCRNRTNSKATSKKIKNSIYHY